MKFHRITSADDLWFEKSFKLYENSFPLHEQRRLEDQLKILPHPDYFFEAIVDVENLAGIICYWENSGYAYIEQFAISPELRGKSWGSASLKEFCQERRLVILEIDPTINEISLRREKFYENLGFKRNDYTHVHPTYRKDFAPHSLVVMTYPRPISQNEYDDFNNYLKNIVMRNVEE